MKRIITGFCLLLSCYHSAYAQDVAMTQFMAAPQVLNPALVGITFPDDFRLATNFRSTPSSVFIDPNVTSIVSFEMCALQDRLPLNDALGIGILGYWNRTPTGGAQNISTGITLTYHKHIGTAGRHYVSAGFQGMMVQKNLDLGRLTYNDFYNNGNQNLIVGSQKPFDIADVSYTDFNTGAHYVGYLGTKWIINGGVSYYHLTQPEEVILDMPTYTVPTRLSAYVGGSFDITKRWILKSQTVYHQQNDSTQIITMASIGFLLNHKHDAEFQFDHRITVGSYYRLNQALAPFVSVEWNKMILGVSYDMQEQAKGGYATKKGFYEISFAYTLKNPKKRDYRNQWMIPQGSL
jgi:type IX secretion system PorP/SprF family membrane protein